MISSHENQMLVENLSRLPHRILQYHHLGELSQLVLHELCHEDCFGLSRAAYFVDNPDFDHLVGMAGYCKHDCKYHKTDVWENPNEFMHDMKEARFYNDMRKVMRRSFKRNDLDLGTAEEVKELGRQMGFKNPHVVSWGMKHGNHGILLFDEEENLCVWRHGLLRNAAALLSFCGI